MILAPGVAPQATPWPKGQDAPQGPALPCRRIPQDGALASDVNPAMVHGADHWIGPREEVPLDAVAGPGAASASMTRSSPKLSLSLSL